MKIIIKLCTRNMKKMNSFISLVINYQTNKKIETKKKNRKNVSREKKRKKGTKTEKKEYIIEKRYRNK